jgi:4,5-DOPA dioxygenase extradiol
MNAGRRTASSDAWAGIARSLPRPRAVLVASAHWETAVPMLTGSKQPETVHDFGGFPEELYQITYRAPGAPELAAEAVALLKGAGIAAGVNGVRGLDHGAWVPLRWMYPDADVPVVQLSLQPELGASAARRARPCARASCGRRRADRRLGTRDAQPARLDGRSAAAGAVALCAGVRRLAVRAARGARHGGARRLSGAGPEAARAHPSEEHYLPLLVAWGAAGDDARIERVAADSTVARS